MVLTTTSQKKNISLLQMLLFMLYTAQAESKLFMGYFGQLCIQQKLKLKKIVLKQRAEVHYVDGENPIAGPWS